jgi:rhodanese-related sulfurtransferase
MSGPPLSVSPNDLYAHLGTAASPIVVDVRPQDAFDSDDKLIVGAFHRAPESVDQWSSKLSFGRPVVVYGRDGRDVSHDVTKQLCDRGIKAVYLAGGIAAWTELKLPTRRNLRTKVDKWVTREHPKIDRIACPWLISRFVEPNAKFIYVAADQVTATANDTGAIPYDVQGAEFGHVGDRCSFDAIVRIFDIKDAALDYVATVVRGADTSRRDLAPECRGLYAISLGLSANFPDDHEMLRHGLVMYDALYAWSRQSQVARTDQPVKAQA